MPKKLKLVKSLKKTTLKKRKKLKLVPSLSKKLNNKTVKYKSIRNTITDMPVSTRSNKKELKLVKSLTKPDDHKQTYISLLEELSSLMYNKGDSMRARAYSRAAESISKYTEPVSDPSVLKSLSGVGKTMIAKLQEYEKTGIIKALEKARADPVNIFTNVYGIGPKKARDLVNAGIKNIEELRERQDELLNDTQKVGLQHYEDLLLRIPRDEIVQFENLFKNEFAKISNKYSGANFEIVGSYRRGAKTSGDIDVIVTSENDSTILQEFVSLLVDQKIITYKLTDGKVKILVIGKLTSNSPSRRLDFLYSPPKEYAFATLYFTGSKFFNTMMRQRALDLGYTLNEHGFHHMVNGKKGKALETPALFASEKDIFDFLNMVYKKPTERIDGNSVVIKPDTVQENTIIDIKSDIDESDNDSDYVPDEKPKKKLVVKKKKRKLTLKKKSPVSSKKIADEFKKNGISVIKALSTDEISKLIKDANDAYYNSDEPFLSDNQYDIVREYLESIDPENPVFDEIGAPVDNGEEIVKNKVKLPYEMWSMDKIKPDTGALSKWKKKYNLPKEYCLSTKLDGVSGLFANGKLYTRGNGKEGQDVSHLIPYLNLPDDKDLVIRGEFLIKKSDFEKHFKGNANPRNTVSGMVNKLSIDKKIKYLNFVAYECIQPELIPSEQFSFLKSKGVDIAAYDIHSDITNEMLSEVLVMWRDTYEYEIDGVIVNHDKIYPRKSGNPDHAFAFKMILSDQMAEAKVVDVIWSISKDGFLKPKIRIEPIELGGVTIEYATAFNAAFVEEKNLGIGAVVQIIRSGDVIPYIMDVTQPAPEPKMPNEEYKWNKTHVDIVLKNVSTNKTVQMKNVAYFFKDIGVAGLSSGNIKRIMEAGFETVPQILAMSVEDFLTVEGFKEKLATKIHTNIKETIESTSLPNLMNASNIFGRGLGEKKIIPILEAYPDILTSEDGEDEKLEMVSEIKGMGKITAKGFVCNINKFVEFMREANLEYKLNEVEEAVEYDESHPLYQKKIVITGFRDSDLEKAIKSVGGEMSSSVSKKTFKVIVKTMDEDSGKADLGRKYNVLITKDKFISDYLS